ncbi:MAG: enoyl-CoA hydratase-related protein [Pseudomonadota bacterium]
MSDTTAPQAAPSPAASQAPTATPPAASSPATPTALHDGPTRLADRAKGQPFVRPLPHLQDTHFEIDFEGIAWVTFDRQGESANTLGRRPTEELGEIVAYLKSPDGKAVRGVAFLSAKSSSYISGADIREFGSFTTEPEVIEAVSRATKLLDELEALKIPTVAAIHGYCLGGGLEFVLACKYRIAVRDENCRVAFPEVKLGIFPGLNGSVRSLREAGAVNAMDAMLTGRMIRATSARGMGLINQLVDSRQALRWAARKAIMRKLSAPAESRKNKLMRTSPIRGQLARRCARRRPPKFGPSTIPHRSRSLICLKNSAATSPG